VLVHPDDVARHHVRRGELAVVADQRVRLGLAQRQADVVTADVERLADVGQCPVHVLG
jgi:hypothetical protein